MDEKRRPSFGHLLQHHLNQPKPNPTQPLVTQLQPPMLPPPPHPKFKASFSSQMVDTTVQYRQSERPSHLTLPSTLSKSQEDSRDRKSFTQKSHLYSMSESLTEMLLSQPESKPPVQRGFAFLKLELFTVGPTQSFKTEIIENKSHSVTDSIQQSEGHQTESQQLLTKRQLYQPLRGPTSTQNYQSLKGRTQWHSLSSLSEKPEQQQSFTQSVIPKLNPSKLQNYVPYTHLPLVTETQQFSIHTDQSPTLPEEHLMTSTLLEPKTHPTPAHPSQSQEPLPHTEIAPFQHSSDTQPTSTPVSSSNWSSSPSTVDHDGQFNTSQQDDSVKSANHTEWRNSSTSQSPMTSNDPRLVKLKKVVRH